MAQRNQAGEQEPEREPRGFGEHTRKIPSENAHEQGWGLNKDERTQLNPDQQKSGGTDYDYGAQDFGDTAVDPSRVQPSEEARKLDSESKP